MPSNHSNTSGVIAGLIIVVLGAIFLSNNLGLVDGLGDLFRFWPAILIALGVWWLAATRLHRLFFPIVLIAIGSILLLREFIHIDLDLGTYWPLILIAVGIVVAVSAVKSPHRDIRRKRKRRRRTIDA